MNNEASINIYYSQKDLSEYFYNARGIMRNLFEDIGFNDFPSYTTTIDDHYHYENRRTQQKKYQQLFWWACACGHRDLVERLVKNHHIDIDINCQEYYKLV